MHIRVISLHGFIELDHCFVDFIICRIQTCTIQIIHVYVIRIARVCKEHITCLNTFCIRLCLIQIVHLQTLQQMVIGFHRQTLIHHFQRLGIILVQVKQHRITGIILYVRLSLLHIFIKYLLCLTITTHLIISVRQLTVYTEFIGMFFLQLQQHIYRKLRIYTDIGIGIFIISLKTIFIKQYRLFIIATSCTDIFYRQCNITVQDIACTIL